MACQKCGQSSVSTHLYGCYEAARWGGRYIYYCPAGLIFITANVMDAQGNILASLVAGPVKMGAFEHSADIPQAVLEKIKGLQNFTPAQVTDLCEMLSMISFFVSGHGNDKLERTSLELSDLHNQLYSISTYYDEQYRYPIAAEKTLQSLISTGDKHGSQKLLNELLGHIFFSSGGDFELIKARVLELIVLLSRASIEGGADVGQIFWLNAGYLKEINNFENLEDLSVWLGSIMNNFISYIFYFSDVKHTDIIYKIVDYIKQNYAKKISLDDIARSVFLSRSYVSKLFRDEMGETITSYIAKVRIEKSKAMLRDSSIDLVDIANLVGFEDQSYFTKVFKKVVGVSPGKYRERRGKINKSSKT